MSRSAYLEAIEGLVTPLTMARMQARMLAAHTSMDGQQALDALRRQLVVMEDLVTELRGLGNGDRAVRLHVARLDLDDLLAQVAAGLGPVIAERGLDLQTRTPGPVTVEADAGRLLAVLLELAQETVQDAPRASACLLELVEDAPQARLRLQVRPPPAFRTGWNPRARAPDVTGARRVLAALGGGIECHAEDGVSWCEAWLPLAPDA